MLGPVTLHQAIVFGVLLLALVLFINGHWRYDVVALLALLAVTMTGVMTGNALFAGFGYPAVVTVAAVPVVSRGLENSHLVEVITRLIARVSGQPMVQASCAFLTPIDHQSNTLVMGLGGYRFGDYWRMGLAHGVTFRRVECHRRRDAHPLVLAAVMVRSSHVAVRSRLYAPLGTDLPDGSHVGVRTPRHALYLKSVPGFLPRLLLKCSGERILTTNSIRTVEGNLRSAQAKRRQVLIAFVLSGGSVLGSTQVGALRALLEHQIRPDFLVGTSSGALNAAYLAQECSLAQVERLANIWRTVTRADVYPGTHLEVGWRLCSGADSLYDNRKFYHFLQQNGIPPTRTFGDLTDVACRVTATHLHSGQMRVFGEDLKETVLDALMASTALPPLHAPWIIDDERYIDGGMVAPLPVQVALDYGATEIYAIHLLGDSSSPGTQQPLRGVPALMVRSMGMAMQNLVEHDLARAAQTPGVRVHDIRLLIAEIPDLIDFSQANRLFAVGYEQMCNYLRQDPSRPWQHAPAHLESPATSQARERSTLFGAARHLASEPG